MKARGMTQPTLTYAMREAIKIVGEQIVSNFLRRLRKKIKFGDCSILNKDLQ
jgi:hypothetical protein